MADFIDWPASGSTYRYWFLSEPLNAAKIKAEPGNYMFVRLTGDGWVPVYIGIADNLRTRIPSHEKWGEAVAEGATAVMAHTSANALARQAEEKALIGHWNPPVNVQYRKRTTLLGR